MSFGYKTSWLAVRGATPLDVADAPSRSSWASEHRWPEDGGQAWQESEWDAWFASMPREDHVMMVAQQWGISPLDILDDSVTESGIYGFPSGFEPR
ncbi:MAG TPA: hypothetical protein VGX23_10870 [Actinocrinis sp.]|nr:hypothetical protein [Actinocrinis sp.]